MNVLTTSGGSRVAAIPLRIETRMPDLRGPLVAALVVAMITTVSALIPSTPPAAQTQAEDTVAASAATAAGVAASQSQLVQPGEVPAGLTTTEWTDIQRQIAAAEAVEAVPATVSRSAATLPTRRRPEDCRSPDRLGQHRRPLLPVGCRRQFQLRRHSHHAARQFCR